MWAASINGSASANKRNKQVSVSDQRTYTDPNRVNWFSSEERVNNFHRRYSTIESKLNIKRQFLSTSFNMDNTSPQNYSALLCALSVGAAIVIAGPTDASEQSTTAEQQQMLGQITTTTTTTSSQHASVWRRTKAEVKELALKSYGLGRRITCKTANLSANFRGALTIHWQTDSEWHVTCV